MSQSLQTIERKSGPAGRPADAAIIWMHGLGADANDFVPLVPELDLGSLSIRFVFPNAQVMPVTVNGGMAMRAWYDIFNFDLGPTTPTDVPHEDQKGLRASQAMIDALIEAEVARGIPQSRILLAGFSQGGAMTLMAGLRHTTRLAGLIVLSGYLPLANLIETERHDASRVVPIFMAHGTYDPVIRYPRAVQSRDVLLKLGYQIDWHTYPMEHSLCAEEVVAIGKFIRRVLAPD